MKKLNEVIIQEIGEIKKLPYLLNIKGNHGSSEDIHWGEEEVLVMESGPNANCVTFCTEVILKALKKMGLDKIIPVEDAILFRDHSFILNYSDYFWGMPAAVSTLGWGEIIHVESSGELSALEGGDVAQLWHINDRGNFRAGHNVIVLSGDPDLGRVNNHSASNLKPEGHYPTYHNFIHEKNGFRREWMFARLDEEKIRKLYK